MTTASDWQRAKNIVADTLELPLTERRAFIDAKLADAPELRQEVESLLNVDTGTSDGESFLNTPASIPNNSAGGLHEPDSALAGQLIGAWRLTKEVGRGGMGVVYLAERADGAYQQQAAVKLLRGAGRQDAARMARERQALASLNHPNIARLMDGGTTSSDKQAHTQAGTPYLVMEYVEGQSIDRYCFMHNLSLQKRIALVQKICNAVQSAHQQLLIHRDIKPSNILVAKEGEPKLLDFGIARLLESESSLDTTQAGALLFTPRYASPEQVKGQPVSVATDVYGLGALLYDLLAGSSPYARMSTTDTTNFAAVMRVVAEDETGRASELAMQYQTLFVNDLKGDLDLILAKACAKNPTERYPTVAALADDLKHWQEDKPIMARAPSFVYRTKKFVSRHKLLSAVSGAMLISIIGGTAAVARQTSIAEQERALAEKRFGDVRTIAGKVLFDYYDDVEKLQNSLPLREKLATDSVAYLDKLSADAGNNLGLLQEVASGYERLGSIYGRTWNPSKGQPDTARQHFKKAIAIREKVFALEPDSLANAAQLASTLQEMADVENAAGTVDDAIALTTRGIAVLEPKIDKAGVSASIPASLTLSKLYRIRSSLDSCAGSNTRGHSAEALALLKSKTAFFKALADAQANDADAQAEYASFLVEYGMTGACRGEFAIGEVAVSQAFSTINTLQAKAKNPLPFQQMAPSIEIELASVYFHQANYIKAAATARSAYHHFEPMVGTAKGDVGLQLMWLLMATKASNYMVRAGREQDFREVAPYLKTQREVADALIRQMPSNRFAQLMQMSGRNLENIVNAHRGTRSAVDKAIASQLILIRDFERDVPPGNVQAMIARARLYSDLVRLYPISLRVDACAALKKSLGISQQSVALDREVLRSAVTLIEDAALAHQWQQEDARCDADSHHAEAVKLANEMEARGVKVIGLQKSMAMLNKPI